MKIRIGQFLIAAAAGTALGGCVSSTEIEIASEQEFAKMRTQVPVSNNATQKVYVTCVAKKIIAQLDPPYDTWDWDIELFDEEAVNAFAMPGGKIGVFTGIFKVATNQDELAAVLGHEVAHVTEEHSLERANTQAVTGGAVNVAAAVLGDSTGFGAQNTAAVLGIGAQLGLFLPFGRKDESEADLVGLEYMSGAGFDPRASVQLWKNMDKEASGAPPEFLSTHPSADTRIGDLIEELPTALAVYNDAKAAGLSPNCQR